MPGKIRFVQTCYACPEQYDGYLDDEMVAYLRLRHGFFYVAAPDVSGERIYEAYPVDSDGHFSSPEERDRHLRFAADAILKWDARGRVPLNEPPAPDVEYQLDGFEDDNTDTDGEAE